MTNGKLPVAEPPFRRLLSWRPGRLANGTVYGTVWQAIRVALQVATIVLLAHTLGARGYGALSGAVALFTILAPLVGLGTGVTLLRDISRVPEQAMARWPLTLRLFLITGVSVFCITWPCAIWLLGSRIAPSVLGLLALAELIAVPALMPSAYWLLANDRAGSCNAILAIPAAARLGGALIVLTCSEPTLASYALAYASLMTAMVVVVMNLVRPPKIPLAATPSQDPGRLVREGAPYIVSNAATIANSEIDKTLLLRMLGPIPAGQYSAAFRVAQAATIPINALVVALGPRLFRGSGHPDYFSKVILYVLIALLYGSGTAAAGWLIAPYAGWLLGADFNASTPMLRLLSLYILSNCVRQVVTATLTGADRQWLRNAIEGGGMTFAVGANLLAIPSLGWQAAASIAIIGDVMVIASGLSLLRYFERRKER